MIKPLFTSFANLLIFCSVTVGIVAQSYQVAVAAPNPLDIKFSESEGMLEFSLTRPDTPISRKNISFSLSDERKALLKIEVDDSSIDQKKYWIQSFDDNKNDPNIKGIMVRQDLKNNKVQIRIRYKKRIDLKEKKQIQLIDLPNGVKVIVPRDFKSQSVPVKAESALNTKPESPKPTLDPSLSRINTLTSSLKEDSTTEVNDTNVDIQSVFDKGSPEAPLPNMEPVRSSGIVQKVDEQGETLEVSTKTVNAAEVPSVFPSNDSLRPMQTSESLRQDSMSNQIKDDTNFNQTNLALNASEKSSDTPNGSFLKSGSPRFDLDQFAGLMSYAVLFLVLLWAASYFFKRGKAQDQIDGNGIKILSQKVVNLSPRQRLMVVETMGHTFVVGSCERGGLSQIAHLSTPSGAIGNMQAASNLNYSHLDQSSRLDALPQFDRQDDYYDQQDYHDNHTYQRSRNEYPQKQSSNPNLSFEESTFVGEDEAYTAEVEPIDHHSSSAHHLNSDAYQQMDGNPRDQLSMSQVDQYNTQLNQVNGVDDQAVGFELGEEEEDANMKPGDLLQWIQKLNGTKG